MEKRNYIPSFLIAYLLSLGGLNRVLSIATNKGDGIMMLNLIPVAGLLGLHFLTSDKGRDLNMNKKALLFVYYIVSIIVVYKYAFRYSTFTYTEALVYVFIPIYISFYKIDVEKILKYMIFFSVLVVPVSGDFFKNIGRGYETIGMSTSYNILPFVIAAALHFWYYRKKAGFFLKLGYAANIYYLIQVVVYGNRGPIVSLFVFGVLLFLHKFDEEGNMNKTTTKTIVATLVVGIIVIVLINNFEDVLYGLYNSFKSIGIELAPLRKSIRKLENGDLTNGRGWVFNFAIDGIRNHYLVGNGIGTIYHNSFYRIPYPHNMFLQIWYDLGAFISLPLLYLIGKAAIVTVFKPSVKKNYIILMILLFTISIPRLCYSAEIWVNIPFWFLMIYTIFPNIYESDMSCERM